MFDPYNFPRSSFTLVTTKDDVAYLIQDKRGEWVLIFYCLGCDCIHCPRVRLSDAEYRTDEYLKWVSNSNWQWNGSLLIPTISPSLLCDKETPSQCHSFIRDGQIQYLGDCSHKLANHTVALPKMMDWAKYKY